MDEEKRIKLGSMPWLELMAREALNNPTFWSPIALGNLKGRDCPACREAKKRAVRRPIIHRGLAIHVDKCPIPARVWRGKPYANVIDDCLAGCPYCVATDEGDQFDEDGQWFYSGTTAVYCSAKVVD